MAYELRHREAMKYCPACVTNDRKCFGEAYWHRLHQIRDVWICPIHSVLLEKSGLEEKERSTMFVAAENCKLSDTPRLIDESKPHPCTMLAVARDAAWFLDQPNLPYRRDAVAHNYLELLRERGFVRQSESKQEAIQNATWLSGQVGQCNMQELIWRNNLELCRRRRSLHRAEKRLEAALNSVELLEHPSVSQPPSLVLRALAKLYRASDFCRTSQKRFKDTRVVGDILNRWKPNQGNVARTELWTEFRRHFSGCLLNKFGFRTSSQHSLELQGLWAPSNKGLHPVRHLLFIRFLGRTAESFFSSGLLDPSKAQIHGRPVVVPQTKVQRLPLKKQSGASPLCPISI